MSDDDRAAKAARAKALLNKKRQQKKAGPNAVSASGAGSSTPTPGSPLVRAYSPSLADPLDDPKSDVAELFSTGAPAQDGLEPGWLSSLPRVGTPSILSPRESPPPSKPSSPVVLPPSPAPPIQPEFSPSVPESHANDEVLESLRAEVQNQHQTITLLVSEKMSLTASLERLSDVSTRAEETESLLQGERTASKGLRERIAQLEGGARQHSAEVATLSRQKKEFEDRYREQERELQLTRGSVEELKAEVDQSQGLIRQLQEQIQGDDRVEQLEASLQNVQNRASELEFQLSKSKQAHASFKSDHDKIEAQLKERSAFAASLEARHAELEGRHAAAQKQLATLTTDHQNLRLEKTSLQSQLDDHLGSIAGLRKAASQSTSQQDALNRQLQTSQAELRSALRRAEEAERIQQDLQNEGSSLMRSLDEMRPKIVELTNVKLELTEKISNLEQAVRERDSVIAQLESSLQASQDQTESLEAKLLEAETARETDRTTAQETQDELQRGYAQLETELSETMASIRELEVERAGQRQLASRHVEDLDRATAASQNLREELALVQRELEERKLAEVEHEDFLERARTDIESLRADLAAKVEEIDELRAELSAAATANSASPSLDKEMLNALKQQHRLELSAAQSQIRALQTTVFEAEARAHSFQKQLSQSEDQLAQLRAQPHAAQRPFSPDHPSRPSSRARTHSDDLRRASLTQRRGSNGVPPAASHAAFAANLSPETRHKRKVSLGMLKARIDSEIAAATASAPPSRAVSPALHVVEEGSPALEPHSAGTPTGSHKRPQFLDESHIFWCHSCRGELVVL
ncbi:hypothetical protein BC834DRAFT_21422 [Gloeopeniophorella convolvens]|nr:hypothetical protein BC834DRAFT_21422 [Gloeopeniophorella convolvens]